ncbi:hypothetical protein, partial [Salmonella enterica]
MRRKMVNNRLKMVIAILIVFS